MLRVIKTTEVGTQQGNTGYNPYPTNDVGETVVDLDALKQNILNDPAAVNTLKGPAGANGVPGANGTNGLNGTNGKSIQSANQDPDTNTVAQIGDLFLNTTSGTLYERSSMTHSQFFVSGLQGLALAGGIVWVRKGNLKGADGAAGTNGESSYRVLSESLVAPISVSDLNKTLIVPQGSNIHTLNLNSLTTGSFIVHNLSGNTVSATKTNETPIAENILAGKSAIIKVMSAGSFTKTDIMQNGAAGANGAAGKSAINILPSNLGGSNYDIQDSDFGTIITANTNVATMNLMNEGNGSVIVNNCQNSTINVLSADSTNSVTIPPKTVVIVKFTGLSGVELLSNLKGESAFEFLTGTGTINIPTNVNGKHLFVANNSLITHVNMNNATVGHSFLFTNIKSSNVILSRAIEVGNSITNQATQVKANETYLITVKDGSIENYSAKMINGEYDGYKKLYESMGSEDFDIGLLSINSGFDEVIINVSVDAAGHIINVPVNPIRVKEITIRNPTDNDIAINQDGNGEMWTSYPNTVLHLHHMGGPAWDYLRYTITGVDSNLM